MTRERVDSAEFWDHEAVAYTAGRAPSEVDRATLRALPPTGDVLELGAGPGVVTKQLLDAGARAVTATDVSPAFVARLQAIADARLTVVLGDHCTLALPAAAFDAVYAMATLHHVRDAERIGVLSAVRGWLRPGGRLALVEDWAFTPSDDVEHRLVRLRSALRERVDPGEVHPTEAAWITLAGSAGLALCSRSQAPRREDLLRYGVLGDDPACRADLAWLSEHAPNPEIPMSILVFSR